MEEVKVVEEDDEEEEEETSEGEELEKDDEEEDSNDFDFDSVFQKIKNEDYFINYSIINYR